MKRLLAALLGLSLVAGVAQEAQGAGKRRPPPIVVTPGGPYSAPPPVYAPPYVTFKPGPAPGGRRRAPPPAVAALPVPRGMLELVFAGDTIWLYVSPTSLRRTGDSAELTMLMIPARVEGGLSHLVGRVRIDCVRRTARVTTLSGYGPSGALLGTSARGETPPTGVGSGGYRLVERACDEAVDAERLRLDSAADALRVTRNGMDTLPTPPPGYDGFGLPLPTGRLAVYAANTIGGADFVDMDSIRADGRGFRARILRVADVPKEIRGAKAALIVTEVKVDCPRKRAWIRLSVFYDADQRYITEIPGEGPDLPGLYGITPLAFGLICRIDEPTEAQSAYGLEAALALSRKYARREHGRLAS